MPWLEFVAEEQNCTGGPELCRSEPVETRLQIQVIIISMFLNRIEDW